MPDSDLTVTIDTQAFDQLEGCSAPLFAALGDGISDERASVYLRLTETGWCEFRVCPQWVNTTPADEWHGVTNRWALPASFEL